MIASDMVFDPDQLAMLTEAFEEAWLSIESQFAGPARRDTARIKLAGIVLRLAHQGILDPEQLQRSAIDVAKMA